MLAAALLGCDASSADGAPPSLGEAVLASGGREIDERFLSPHIIETFYFSASAPAGARYYVSTAEADLMSEVFGNFIVEADGPGYREFADIDRFGHLINRGSLAHFKTQDDFLRSVGEVVGRAERPTGRKAGNSAIVVADDEESYKQAIEGLGALADRYSVMREEFSPSCAYAKFAGGKLPSTASVMVVQGKVRTVDLADPTTRDCFVQFFARNTGLAVDLSLARRMAGFEVGSDPSGPCELVRIVDYPSPYGSSRVSTDGCPTAPDLHAAIYSYFLVSSERLSRPQSGREPVVLDEFEAACLSHLADAVAAANVCDF